MIKNAKPWERIEFEKPASDAKSQPGELFRLPVHGGWLVTPGWGTSPGPLTFIPDPDHKWNPRV